MTDNIIKKRFGEMWQQAEAMTTEDDEAIAVFKFMQRYGELIVRECIWVINNHPMDAAERIADIYEVDTRVSIDSENL
jgi:hypothetical protein